MDASDRWVALAIKQQLERSSLPEARERHLLRLSHRNDRSRDCEAARAELWESHAKLVVAIANRYRRPGIDVMDLINSGHIGLHTAIDRFEPDAYGSRLSSYAAGWIRSHIQDYIRRNVTAIPLPSSAGFRQLARSGSRLTADARKSCQRDMVEATDSEIHSRIGQRIGLSGDEVASALRLMQGGMISLHAPDKDENGAGHGIADSLTDEAFRPEDDAISRLDEARLRNRILRLADEILGERERAVFLARCLPEQSEPVHLDILARTFGVSSERIHQLETSARRKIATGLAGMGYAGTGTSAAEPLPASGRAPRRRGTQPVERVRALA